ncbi:hypothetical protein [Phenylobacterium sp.]|uniref:hypothetical protein n=1 Tax=Phenylobacterium sp. TaxID=1871053 RepID=UPI00120912DD|nr:hypothetical protein [Phenylobacterium sp.]THD60625.1 MAG: hypothetical protein E8A49_14480 [Phenylobacterium sp.]
MPPRDEIDPAPLWIGGLLILGLVLQLAWPAPAPASRAARPAALPAPLASSVLPLDYPQILVRPLFAPARGLTAAQGQTASAALSDYTLVGVEQVGNRSEAVFRSAAGDVLSVRLGEALLGWRLAAVEPGGAVLQQGDVTRTIRVASSAAPPTGVR